MALKRAIALAKFFLGWPLGIVALVFIAKFLVNDSQVLSKLKNINFQILVLSLICFGVYYLLRVSIWKRMLKLKGHNLPLHQLGYAWELSEIVRFVPGAVLPFISRAKLFEDLEVPKHTTLKLMFTEIEL